MKEDAGGGERRDTKRPAIERCNLPPADVRMTVNDGGDVTTSGSSGMRCRGGGEGGAAGRDPVFDVHVDACQPPFRTLFTNLQQRNVYSSDDVYGTIKLIDFERQSPYDRIRCLTERLPFAKQTDFEETSRALTCFFSRNTSDCRSPYTENRISSP